MKKAGAILREVVSELYEEIKPGISTNEIDKLAEEKILKKGGKPSFKTVEDYKWTTCLPVNEQAVHTPPTKRILKDGDILTLDIGVYVDTLHTDYADTIIIGKNNDKRVNDFLKAGKNALEKSLSIVKKGTYLGEIAKIMEDTIESSGYKVLKQLTGHGVGRELHEDPYVLNYLDSRIEDTYQIQPGLTIAVEIIYSESTEEIAYEKSVPWSIITQDKSLSACFEKSIAITDKNTFILT